MRRPGIRRLFARQRGLGIGERQRKERNAGQRQHERAVPHRWRRAAAAPTRSATAARAGPPARPARQRSQQQARSGEPDQQHGGEPRRGLGREEQLLQAQAARLDDQRRELIARSSFSAPTPVVSSPRWRPAASRWLRPARCVVTPRDPPSARDRRERIVQRAGIERRLAAVARGGQTSSSAESMSIPPLPTLRVRRVSGCRPETATRRRSGHPDAIRSSPVATSAVRRLRCTTGRPDDVARHHARRRERACHGFR